MPTFTISFLFSCFYVYSVYGAILIIIIIIIIIIVSVLVQRYNAVLLHDTLPATDCTD